MKKTILLIIFFYGMARGVFCQPQFDSISFPNSVNLFDKFEFFVSLLNTYPNPYDPDSVSIQATIYSPGRKTYKVNAFYYEGYSFKSEYGVDSGQYINNSIGWKIRFTPDQVGTWIFTIQGKDTNGTSFLPNNGSKAYLFTCNAINNADGFISKANKLFLKRDVVRNGQRQFQSYFPVGPNVAWYSSYPYDDYSQPLGIHYYE